MDNVQGWCHVKLYHSSRYRSSIAEDRICFDHLRHYRQLNSKGARSWLFLQYQCYKLILHWRKFKKGLSNAQRLSSLLQLNIQRIYYASHFTQLDSAGLNALFEDPQLNTLMLWPPCLSCCFKWWSYELIPTSTWCLGEGGWGDFEVDLFHFFCQISVGYNIARMMISAAQQSLADKFERFDFCGNKRLLNICNQ